MKIKSSATSEPIPILYYNNCSTDSGTIRLLEALGYLGPLISLVALDMSPAVEGNSFHPHQEEGKSAVADEYWGTQA